MAIWALMNLGLSWNLQPFMPQVQAAQNSGERLVPGISARPGGRSLYHQLLLDDGDAGLGAARGRRGTEGEARAQFKALCLLCFIAMIVPALCHRVLRRLADVRPGRNRPARPDGRLRAEHPALKKMPPMYARAIARMKFGKYSEAEWEIIRELEKCEDDFDGWMMLAGLYANQFNDLPRPSRASSKSATSPGPRRRSSPLRCIGWPTGICSGRATRPPPGAPCK